MVREVAGLQGLQGYKVAGLQGYKVVVKFRVTTGKSLFFEPLRGTPVAIYLSPDKLPLQLRSHWRVIRSGIMRKVTTLT